jgi:hypothetical protein
MGQKLVIGGNGPAALVPLSLAEQAELDAEQVASLAERDRIAARTSAEVSEEDVLSPMFDQASSKDVKLIKAVALALLDGLNVERTARGAQTISPAQLRALVKTRLEEMV